MSDRITVEPLFTDDGNPASKPTSNQPGPVPTEHQVGELGAGSRSAYDAVTARLLASHRSADLGAMGTKLNEMIGVAKGLDYQKGRKSLVESALGFLRNERERIVAHVETVQGRLDTLKAQLDRMVAAERDHVGTLAELQVANRAFHDAMQQAATQGDAWLAAITVALTAPPDAADAFSAAERTALQQRGTRLERAVNDFRNAMALAQQEAITIQLEINNAQVLLDEFERAETLVLPALRSIVGQQLIQIDQQHGAETDALLRATLDDALRRQAQLTGDNSVALAKLQQGATIRTATLLDCEAMLGQAATKVREIQEAGRQARLADAANRTEIERRLLAHFSQ